MVLKGWRRDSEVISETACATLSNTNDSTKRKFRMDKITPNCQTEQTLPIPHASDGSTGAMQDHLMRNFFNVKILKMLMS